MTMIPSEARAQVRRGAFRLPMAIHGAPVHLGDSRLIQHLLALAVAAGFTQIPVSQQLSALMKIVGRRPLPGLAIETPAGDGAGT